MPATQLMITNETKNTILVGQGRLADTFFKRLKGLLGSKPLQEQEGLLLKNEKSIHTLFMTFPIDVIYIDCNLQVIKLDSNMSPYRLGRFVKDSVYILEVAAGTIQKTKTAVGDQLSFTA